MGGFNWRKRLLTASIALALSATAPIAAAETTAQNRAAAQALFDEGKALMESNSPADACPKLEESLELDPAIGTRFQLGRCYELLGRTASAWNLYLEVAAETRAEGQTEREQYARQQATRLEPTLNRLTIIVPEQHRIDGLVIERDGLNVGKGQWGVKVPVDPGSHVIKASAPGKKDWSTTIEVTGAGAVKTLTVPPLEDAPVTEQPADPLAPAPPGEADTLQQSSGSTQRTTGLVVAGAGVVGIGVGSVFGLIASGKKDDAGCDGNVCPDDAARDAYESAQSAGNVSTITFIAGGALLAGGAVLYFTAPKGSTETGFRAGARGTPGGAEIVTGWAF